MDDLKNYIDNKDKRIFISKTLNKYKETIEKLPDKSIFINTDFLKYTNFPTSNILCPCIGSQSTLYCIYKNRYANIKEKLSLQGFDTNFKKVVSNTQLNKQIGNSMSVNVLRSIYESILN